MPFVPDPIPRHRALRKIEGKRKKRLPSSVPFELVYDTLDRLNGNMNLTAEELDLNYVVFVTWVEKDKRLSTLVVKHREKMLDVAEEKLFNQISRGDQKAVFFTLRTLGKDRGYVPKTENESLVIQEDRTTQVDLTKLSTDELKDLRKMMDKGLVEVTPYSVETN